MKVVNTKTYGGFPRPASSEVPNEQRRLFSSFRNALLNYLNVSGCKKIWIPYFYCHEVTAYVQNAVDVAFYHIDNCFEPELKSLQGGVLLYPNYFGICDAQVSSVLDTFGYENVILDYAHSLAAPPDSLASITSLRKLLPIPDGAEIRCTAALPEAGLEELSLAQVAHLTTPNQTAAYKEYLKNEKTFATASRSGISKESFIALACADADHISALRARNFEILSDILYSSNQLSEPTRAACPLCYPFLPVSSIDREALLTDGLFLPQYWPNPYEEHLNDFEIQLTDRTLYLPVSQTLDEPSMLEIAQLIGNAMGNPI